MSNVRNPKQKRALETKNRILEVGYGLFCSKGYYRTNTIEIAKTAGISTGALYNYYKDKKEIFVAAFEKHFNEQLLNLYEELDECDSPMDIDELIRKWADFFIRLYHESNGSITQLSYMMSEDNDIKEHFCHHDDEFIAKMAEIFSQNNVCVDHLIEKVFLAYILLDALGQMKTTVAYSNVDITSLEEIIIMTVVNAFK